MFSLLKYAGVAALVSLMLVPAAHAEEALIPKADAYIAESIVATGRLEVALDHCIAHMGDVNACAASMSRLTDDFTFNMADIRYPLEQNLAFCESVGIAAQVCHDKVAKTWNWNMRFLLRQEETEQDALTACHSEGIQGEWCLDYWRTHFEGNPDKGGMARLRFSNGFSMSYEAMDTLLLGPLHTEPYAFVQSCMERGGDAKDCARAADGMFKKAATAVVMNAANPEVASQNCRTAYPALDCAFAPAQWEVHVIETITEASGENEAKASCQAAGYDQKPCLAVWESQQWTLLEIFGMALLILGALILFFIALALSPRR